ncbi:hypothetical protein P0D88_52945 [Paraburkholderia sp. RL18-103-BIB-C]|uniref:hypothetical protein n=1 Tax=Paraburkholderia sp. RL18-103-BIB-C TaxID=3031637 RepID=UPI0038BD1715
MQQFGDHEIEQGFACGELRTGKRQDVALEPMDEGLQIGGQYVGPRFIATQPFERGVEEAVVAASAGIGPTLLECHAFGAGATGDPGPQIHQRPALLQDMKHIAVTRRIGPGRFLAGTQPGAGVGNRVIGSQSLRLQIQQMDGPGIAIALSFGASR